jgi:dihydroorotate dehydrogenase
MLKLVSQCNKKKAVIISSGGITSKEDLKERYELGADLFQIYTSFVYEGPRILDDLLSDS